MKKIRIEGCGRNFQLDCHDNYTPDGVYSSRARTGSVATQTECPEAGGIVDLSITTHAELDENEILKHVPVEIICLYLKCPFNNLNS